MALHKETCLDSRAIGKADDVSAPRVRNPFACGQGCFGSDKFSVFLFMPFSPWRKRHACKHFCSPANKLRISNFLFGGYFKSKSRDQSELPRLDERTTKVEHFAILLFSKKTSKRITQVSCPKILNRKTVYALVMQGETSTNCQNRRKTVSQIELSHRSEYNKDYSPTGAIPQTSKMELTDFSALSSSIGVTWKMKNETKIARW